MQRLKGQQQQQQQNKVVNNNNNNSNKKGGVGVWGGGVCVEVMERVKQQQEVLLL